MSAEDTPTPVERLSFGLQTTAELREAISAINHHLAVCAASVKTAKERNEALMSELKQRQEDAHRLALAAFACPKCGNQKLDDIRMGDPCGYEWHPLTEARVGDGGEPQSFLTAHYGDGPELRAGSLHLGGWRAGQGASTLFESRGARSARPTGRGLPTCKWNTTDTTTRRNDE